MRKASSRIAGVLPLGIKNRVQTELPALVALTAIGQPWFSPSHQADLLAVALVSAELAPADSVQARCAGQLQRLCASAIVAEDRAEIALNLAACLPWLQQQANTRVQRALDAVMARCYPAAA